MSKRIPGDAYQRSETGDGMLTNTHKGGRTNMNTRAWKSKFLLVFWLCVLLAGISPLNRNALASSDEIDFKAIDGYISAKMGAARIPGVALAIVKGDQIVYLKGYGRADPAGRAVTPQTSFIIGSVTKAFTALAVMQLVEAGQVELDAPVQQYIPWFGVADPQASAQITVRQLLTMTSGLPQIMETQLWNEQDDGALERSVRYLKTAELIGPPGQSFGYSNGNYDTLGLIVQTVSGQSYEDYVKQQIFAPLDMQHSFVSQAEAMQHGMASGYRRWFGIPVPVTLPYHRAELPAGFVISSAEDMAHFLIAQMNGGRYRDVSVLSPGGIALMHTEPAPKTYAMGWEAVQVNGRTLINHDGGWANFQSSVFFDPQARVGVFVAANVMSGLDGLASPAGNSSLDGITTRGMAESVLSLATNQPMPAQGLGVARLALMFDLVLLALTIALVVALARIPGRYRRLTRRGIASSSSLAWRIGLVAALHFVWPLLLLYAALKVPNWILFVLFLPDLVYWLQAVALVVFIKGLLEIALLWRVFRQTHQRQILQPV
jgi:CubicO group peptidase (beta-lactamase class C family)